MSKLTSESSVNYALRVLKPVFEKGADSVELTQVAEDEYSHRVQDALRKRVWNAGCQSVNYFSLQSLKPLDK